MVRYPPPPAHHPRARSRTSHHPDPTPAGRRKAPAQGAAQEGAGWGRAQGPPGASRLFSVAQRCGGAVVQAAGQ